MAGQWQGRLQVERRFAHQALGGAVVGKLRQRLADQTAAMLEIAAGDELALRMGLQPTRALGDQLVHLAVADPVVLAVVEGRDEYVQVGEHFRQAHPPGQGNVPVRARPGLGVRGINGDGIAKGLEQCPHRRFAPAPQAGNLGGQRQRLGGQLGALRASSTERAAEDP